MARPDSLHIDPDRYGEGELEKAQKEALERYIPSRKLVALMLAGMSALTACGLKEPTRKGEAASKMGEIGKGGAELVVNFGKGIYDGTLKPGVDKIRDAVKEHQEAEAERQARWKAELARQEAEPPIDISIGSQSETDSGSFRPTEKNRLVVKVRLPNQNGWTSWILRPEVGSDPGFNVDVSEDKKAQLFAAWKAEFEKQNGRKMKPSEERTLWKEAYAKLKQSVLDQIGAERKGLGLDMVWDVPSPTREQFMYSDNSTLSTDDAPGIEAPGLRAFEARLNQGVRRKGVRFKVASGNQGAVISVYFIPVEMKEKLQ